MDHAKRAYDHSFGFDPVVRSLLDMDFYKFLMLQFIYLLYPNTRAAFALKNRTVRVRLADIINIDELRQQLDHVRTLRFQPNELIWLQGATFAGQSQIFRKGFIDFLRTLKMPSYRLERTEDGQFDLVFEGLWVEISLWEIYALTIISELKSRTGYRQRSKFELDILFANAKAKLWRKLDVLQGLEGLALSEFGTRRRAGFLWQEWTTLAAADMLGNKFVGTSNAYLAFKHGFEAVGTNAHELPMVFAALCKGDRDCLKDSQYEVLKQWQDVYRGNLLVALPDTFGTTQFLRDAPIWLNQWRGFRPDSKKAIPAGEEMVAFWKDRMQNPLEKLNLWSDGLDVVIPGFTSNGEDIPTIHRHFEGLIGRGYGWGTNMTNDFRECDPRREDIFDPLSIVCKIVSADDFPAVKLSDNYSKATGPEDQVALYRDVFGSEGMTNAPTLV